MITWKGQISALLKADLHIHSEFSFDCGSGLDEIISRCVSKGVNCIALADHGSAEGGLKLQRMAPFKVIVAEEVLTPMGEIMGLFLQETVPTNIPPEEAITRIKAQGGLVGLPHPYDRLRSGVMRFDFPEELLKEVDVIEGFNARAIFAGDGKRARALAARLGRPCSAGSDAHTVHEIGKAWIEMPDFSSKEDFCAALARGTIRGSQSTPLVHFSSMLRSLRRKLLHR